MEEPVGKMYLWRIINDNTVIKKGDKSFFEHRGTAIPKTIKWFFHIEDLKHGVRRSVVLRYQRNDYYGRFEVDSHNRSRLFWHSNLSERFQDYYLNDQFPFVRFLRIQDNIYEVEFLNEKLIENEKEAPYISSFSATEEKKIVYSTKYERNPKLRKNDRNPRSKMHDMWVRL